MRVVFQSVFVNLALLLLFIPFYRAGAQELDMNVTVIGPNTASSSDKSVFPKWKRRSRNLPITPNGPVMFLNPMRRLGAISSYLFEGISVIIVLVVTYLLRLQDLSMAVVMRPI